MMVTRHRSRQREADRPRIRPEFTYADWMAEAVVLCLLLALIGFSVYWYARLPQIVPTHFDIRGNVNDTGSKVSILFLPALGIFLYAMLTILCRFPYIFNFTETITMENAPRQYRLAIRFIRVLKGVIIVILFYISTMVVRSAMNNSAVEGIWMMAVILGAIFIPMIIYLVVASKKK